MYKKIGIYVLAVCVLGLTAGCGLIGYDVQEGETPSVVITAPPDTSQSQETPEPEQTPSDTPSPSPSPSPSSTPTPGPIDMPTFIAQRLGSVPDLILTEGVTSGTVAPNKAFAVALEEDVSTGYLWQWDAEDSAIASVLDTRYQPESEDSEAGAPGTHIWAFKISETGEYTLDFTLVAPDGGVGNVQSMTVTVE